MKKALRTDKGARVRQGHSSAEIGVETDEKIDTDWPERAVYRKTEGGSRLRSFDMVLLIRRSWNLYDIQAATSYGHHTLEPSFFSHGVKLVDLFQQQSATSDEELL